MGRNSKDATQTNLKLKDELRATLSWLGGGDMTAGVEMVPELLELLWASFPHVPQDVAKRIADVRVRVLVGQYKTDLSEHPYGPYRVRITPEKWRDLTVEELSSYLQGSGARVLGDVSIEDGATIAFHYIDISSYYENVPGNSYWFEKISEDSKGE